MAGDQQVGEFVEQHVVANMDRHVLDPARDPDRACTGGAAPPPAGHRVDPAHAPGSSM